MRYNDPKHTSLYNKGNVYPAIHDDIMKLIVDTGAAEDPKPTLDLGSSIGLLSKRLSEIMPLVVGVEGSVKDFQTARQYSNENLIFYRYYLDSKTIEMVKDNIARYGIKYIVARRIFPEIFERTDADFLKELSGVFYGMGIERIYLEGRKKDKRAVNALSDADKEVMPFSEDFVVSAVYNDCRMLRRL